MANITVSDLSSIGSDLFSDSESFLSDLVEGEFGRIQGGLIPFTSDLGSTIHCGTCIPLPTPIRPEPLPRTIY